MSCHSRSLHYALPIWIALDLLDHHFGRRQRLLGLGGLGGVLRVAVHVVVDPALQPALHVVAFLERSDLVADDALRSEEHTSELQSLMRTSYAVFCLNKKIQSNSRSK